MRQEQIARVEEQNQRSAELDARIEKQNLRIQEQNKKIEEQSKETQQLTAAIMKLVERPASDPGCPTIRVLLYILTDKEYRTGLLDENFKQDYGRDGFGDEDVGEELDCRCVHAALNYTYSNLRSKITMIGHWQGMGSRYMKPLGELCLRRE